MSKETDALMTCVSDLLGAAEHIKAAREACETLKTQKDNPRVVDEAITRIDGALSESLFLVLSAPIVMHNIAKYKGAAKSH
jgi:hypothetical protein